MSKFGRVFTDVNRTCHNSRLFAGFHLVATSIWFIVVTSRLVVSSVHALRKMQSKILMFVNVSFNLLSLS